MQRKGRFWTNISDHMFTALAYLSSLIGIFVLLFVLYILVKHGLKTFNLHMLITPTLPANLKGGLSNAILGSIYMVLISMVISIPFGILIAIYLTQYNKKGFINKLVRLINDCLLTSPSIVIGIFVFAFIVHPMHNFSALAGSIALSLISIPMISRSTEDVLYLVSPMLQEAALSLGLTQSKVIIYVILKSAKNGIITAVLLALARIFGETAPLLFTSLSNQYTSLNLWHSMASLPVVIFQYAMSPYANWQDLAWSGSLFIVLIILVINLIARTVFSREK